MKPTGSITIELPAFATKDFLTGLSNRRHFFELAERRIDGLHAAGRECAVATLDIDHFKKINDTWGHDGGDLALKAVARALQSHMRPEDVVARFGGEEFVVLAGDLDADSSREYFEALRERIAALAVELPDGRTFSLTTSIGVCRLPASGTKVPMHAALNESDRMLYIAKAGGRNRVEMTAMGG